MPPKKLESGQIRNPKTGRSIKIGGAVYKKLVAEGVISAPRKASPKSSPKKRSSTKKISPTKISPKKLEAGQMRNPKTGRPVKIGGAVYKKLVEAGVIKAPKKLPKVPKKLSPLDYEKERTRQFQMADDRRYEKERIRQRRQMVTDISYKELMKLQDMYPGLKKQFEADPEILKIIAKKRK